MSTKRLRDNPRVLTLSSVLVGYALIGNYSAIEQNAIGNWLMLVGQLLETNAAFQQAIEESHKGNTFNINSKQYKNGGSPFMNNPPLDSSCIPKDSPEIQKIKQALRDILSRLEELERNQ